MGSSEPNVCGSQDDAAIGCQNSYGKSTAKMKQESTFTNWDSINVWSIGENQTYPYLRTVSAGDINKDRIVNFLDLCIICKQNCLYKSSASDINKDHITNFLDLCIVAEQ